MSKRDPRKALVVPLPRDLRRALRARARRGQGLSATARQVLRSAELTQVNSQVLSAPTGRPLILQLSDTEQRRLSDLAHRLQLTPEDALHCALAQELLAPSTGEL